MSKIILVILILNTCLLVFVAVFLWVGFLGVPFSSPSYEELTEETRKKVCDGLSVEELRDMCYDYGETSSFCDQLSVEELRSRCLYWVR